MFKLMLMLLFGGLLALGAYEIPTGVVGLSGLEQAQKKAKAAQKPVVLVVAIKTQPET
ncbi:hypothetical protein [Roseibacillus ishigakijimensis]|uniref:Uncharacterized protein n=1 Tax=Roseibacillus ishigakijimensis TaxID=454146 RepID=A0A934RQQ1_9BACT|nr:hypothetical protein [Roseibacillus ishigakijimensis]MBK1833698.1 hypothetical protein [Roseibacillus ishigakijimensis]